MAYFNHAFRKDFIGFGSVRTTGDTDNLVAGQIGLFDAKTFNALPVVGSNANPKKMFLIGQGSMHDVDGLSPFYAGLQEFVRSRPINPAYIEKFYVNTPSRPVADEWTIGYNGVSTCDPITGECSSKYTIRVDVRGEAALRAYNRNLYRYFTYETPCCDDCDTDCSPATADPYLMAKSFVEQINGDVELSKFVKAELILQTAISDANQVTYDKFILTLLDEGNPAALAAVQGAYSTYSISRQSRAGITSVYSVIVADGVTPASYTPTSLRLPADLCGDCPTGWTEGSEMDIIITRPIETDNYVTGVSGTSGISDISFEDALALLMGAQTVSTSVAYQYRTAIVSTLAALDADVLTADVTVTPTLISTQNGSATIKLRVRLTDATPSASLFTLTLSDLVIATVVALVNTNVANIGMADEYSVTDVEFFCFPAAGSATAWVADGSVYKTKRQLCATIPKPCGASTSSLTAITTYFENDTTISTLAREAGYTDCAEVISLYQLSKDYYDVDCAEKPIPVYGYPPSYNGVVFKECDCDESSPYVSGAVGIRITAAYEDTKFGNCSFSPLDYYNLQPLKLEVAKIDDAELCTDQHTKWSVTHLTSGKQGTGFGETVLREYMLSMGYKGENFQFDPRFREVMDQQHLNVIDRKAYYKTYYLLHSIPNSTLRGMNVTNYDEKYLLAFHFKEDVDTTAFEGLLTGYAALNNVELETY